MANDTTTYSVLRPPLPGLPLLMVTVVSPPLISSSPGSSPLTRENPSAFSAQSSLSSASGHSSPSAIGQRCGFEARISSATRQLP